jgi:hypothetical protein
MYDPYESDETAFACDQAKVEMASAGGRATLRGLARKTIFLLLWCPGGPNLEQRAEGH